MNESEKQFSFIRAASSTSGGARKQFPISDAVVEVLDDGHYGYSGYKWRDTPSGSGAGYLSFHAYLKARDAEAWAEWAKAKPQLDIQLDFINWCIGEEKERGFVDEAQKTKILGRYEHARQQVKKEYSDGAANRSQPDSPQTNRPSAAAGYGR